MAARKVAGSVALLLLVVLAAAAGSLAGLTLVYSVDLPQIADLERYKPLATTELYDVHGQLFGSFAMERRSVVQYDDFPPMLRQAVISIEDKNFESHWGVNLFRVLGAAYHDLTSRGRAQGASTLTMQLARNLFLSPDRTFRRKLQEVFLSIQIEHSFTKQQIFTLYGNQIYLGHGVYGFEAGANYYFSKPARELTLPEAALLAGSAEGAGGVFADSESGAGVPAAQHGDQRDAGGWRDHGSAGQRGQGRAAGAAPGAAAEQRGAVVCGGGAARAGAAVRHGDGPRGGAEGVHDAGSCSCSRRRTARCWMGWPCMSGGMDGAGIAECAGLGRIDGELPASGLESADHAGRVFSRNGGGSSGWAGDGEDRRCAAGYAARRTGRGRARRIRRSCSRLGDIVYVHDHSSPSDPVLQGTLEQDSGAQGALMAVDNATGDVLAMVGGRDFNLSQFNRATQAERQTGSSFKPYVYTAAIENGATPEEMIADTPATFQTAGGPYTPHDYEPNYLGNITLEKAFADSRNIPALRLAERVGMRKVIDVAHRFGITRDIPPYLPVALGSVEVTLAQQVAAYSSFPNDGVRVTPHLLRRVTNADGMPLSEDQAEVNESTSAKTARTMMMLLQQVTNSGTAAAAKALNHPLGGKTGTTSDFTDAWFLGFSPSVTCGVWMGYDTRQSLGDKETGARAALPVWMDFMKAADVGKDEERFPGQ